MSRVPYIPAEKHGFLRNLIRVGMVVGFWMGVAATALTDMSVACIFGELFTAACAVSVTWDVRKAWKRYRAEDTR